MSDSHNTIDDLMLENRKFPPSAEFKRQALVVDTVVVRRGQRGLPGFLGPASRRSADVEHRVADDL